ncbi:MAG: tRNA (N(6)-L-threonylcarbamoyladenosine(37)-C(2))-methylthiotransferase MtaB [Saprospiraceae bacterium]|nr:tRNA (N(6)-L-threonylcarbamoyladenosine(37)-C(2))-methylthiotransferase MtaB [Saprospiraceae bacterium]
MATPISVSFHTLGCKLNFAETSTIKQQFEAAGYHVNPFEEGADICVINTCSVTDFADRKCRKVVRQALNKNRDSKIVVVGCYAQLKPNEIADIEGVDLVLGAAEKFNILSYIDRLDKTPGKGWVKASDISALDTFSSAFSFGDRTRSFLKIQDGCDYNCSFCTIPQARGKSRNDTIGQVLKTAELIAQKGIKEIVLTGVNIGDFRDQSADGSTPLLLRDLLKSLDREASVPRLRISSIEPNLCSDEIIDFVARSTTIMPHFHMPLQSGNDKQLAKMRRRYRRSLYADRINRIRSQMPHACIGADVIVGFPGESRDDFLVTKQFLSELDVNYLHVFTYSERANTLAATMQDAVPLHVRRTRNEELRDLSSRKQRLFYTRHMGTISEVLLEKSRKPNWYNGFTENYIKVEIEHSPGLKINSIQPLLLDSLKDSGVMQARADLEIHAGS